MSPLPKLGDDSNHTSSSGSSQTFHSCLGGLGSAGGIGTLKALKSNVSLTNFVSLNEDDKLCCVIEEEDLDATMKPQKPAENQKQNMKEQLVISQNIRKIIEKQKIKRDMSDDNIIKKTLANAHKYIIKKFDFHSQNTSRMETQSSMSNTRSL